MVSTVQTLNVDPIILIAEQGFLCYNALLIVRDDLL